MECFYLGLDVRTNLFIRYIAVIGMENVSMTHSLYVTDNYYHYLRTPVR